MKKFVSWMLIAMLVLSFTACGAAGPNPKKEPADLKGTWMTTSEDMAQYAEIDDTTITIWWYNADEKTKALYWAGNYNAPTEPGSFKWTSLNDRTQTDLALLASLDDEKVFTYSDGVLSYASSLMGVSKTIELKKVEG